MNETENYNEDNKIGFAIKKMLRFYSKHKIFAGVSVFVMVIVILRIVTLPFIAVYFPLFPMPLGDAASITFDKWQMDRVNIIKIETPNGITVIEDKKLIRDIVKRTMVADSVGVCVVGFNESVFFRLYRDNVLVRNMEFESKHDQVRVYSVGSKHWVFFTLGLGVSEGSLVALPRELVERIESYLSEDGNSLIFGPWQ